MSTVQDLNTTMSIEKDSITTMSIAKNSSTAMSTAKEDITTISTATDSSTTILTAKDATTAKSNAKDSKTVVLSAKNSNNFPQEKLCQGKDIFERMNYLYQAGVLASSKNSVVAAYCGSSMKACAKKAVLRIDHNIKRTICQVCNCPLVPGKTSKVRLKKKKIFIICKSCENSKKIPMNIKKDTLWFEKPEAVAEMYNYGPKKQ
ncbi:ribonuclease P protein subunit p21 [Trichogramma pretiosum]|uniref:ribonuclease P protein subunit p21 n=1 Tax=Trichogramma pretiosum TaxID=7493 RepID=UPI0006C9621B|nr:ribonuclease P protein subunit p21 [Trichogramma pretiosum]